jgi:hypothetical protein
MSEDISGNGFWFDGPAEKEPMHPEDFRALLLWVKAKEGWEKGEGEIVTGCHRLL